MSEEDAMKRKPKLLVVGSFVMDTISSTKVFPQAGQTVLGETYRTAPGGKGANQAMEAQLLGADVTMVGKVGEDAFGEALISSLKHTGVNVEHVMKNPDVQSAVGNIILQKTEDGQTQNRIIVLPGANMTIQPEEVAFLKDTIKNYDMLLLQLEIPMEINRLVAQYAHDAGVPVMLNPAPIAPLPEDLLGNIAYLSPNETEAASLLGCVVRKENGHVTTERIADIQNAMRKKGLSKLLITLGDDGAMIVSQNTVIHEPSVRGITAVDPTAAGDSFVGAFCTGIYAGLTETEALQFSNLVAAVTVSKMGAQPSLSTLDEVIAFHEKAGRNTALLEKAMEKLCG